MPELPEVQTTVNGLRETIVGLTIADVWTDYGSAFHKGKDSIKDPVYFEHFKEHVVGGKVVGVDRIAKNILIRIQKGSERRVILVHMKMTGHIMYGRYSFVSSMSSPRRRGSGDALTDKGHWSPAKDERASLSDPFNRFLHFVVTFSNHTQVVMSDMRKFAKVTLIHENEIAASTHLKDIGPDPLSNDFDFETFKSRILRRPTGRIKNVLMDQTVMAGVGNIYSDEALWLAGIHPEEKPHKIPDKTLKLLYSGLIKVLKKGIDFGGDSMSEYRNINGERGKFQAEHNAYRKTGEKCSKAGCKGIITRKVVGGRSAHFCNVHQKLLR